MHPKAVIFVENISETRKGDVSPMPNALIALIFVFIILVTLYFLVSKGIIALDPLVTGAKNCLSEPTTCLSKIGSG